MSTFIFANNVNTTLAGAVSNSATSFTLSSTANLPASIPAGSVLVITLNDAATRQNFEIVYATAITGATVSGLLRGQEGTAALAWLTGDFAYSPPTAGQQASFGQLAGTNTWTGANTFNQPVVVGAAVASNEAVNMGQFPSSLTTNGYKKYPDPNSPTGYFIEQWGSTVTNNANGSVTVAYPIAFPNVVLNTSATNIASAPPSGFPGINPSSLSSFVLWAATSGMVSAGAGVAFYWRAIGY